MPSCNGRRGLTQCVTNFVFDLTLDDGLGVYASVTATPTLYGWVGVIPGSASGLCPIPFPGSVQSVASYSDGVSGTSAPVDVDYWVSIPTECSV